MADTVEFQQPVTETPEPTPEPQLVTITIQGKEYTVPPEVAAELKRREEEAALLAQAREYRPPVMPPAPEPAKPTDPLEGVETLLFENPKEAIKKLRESIVEQVTTLYQADQGRRQFWADFYTEYPELRRHQTLVNAVLQQHTAEWANVPVTQAKQLLAKAVKQELAEIAKTLAPTATRTHAEDSRVARPRPPASETPAAPKSITELIRDRRNRFRPAVPTP